MAYGTYSMAFYSQKYRSVNFFLPNTVITYIHSFLIWIGLLNYNSSAVINYCTTSLQQLVTLAYDTPLSYLDFQPFLESFL